MNSVLIDTNLLVLLVVGSTDRRFIRLHKRTKSFIYRDYDELTSLLSGSRELWVTSHCLAETSNLLKQTDKAKAQVLLHNLAVYCGNARESHIPKETIFGYENYFRLGVTDSGFIRSSEHVSRSITADLDLYFELSRLGREVTNFHHVRATYLT